MSSEPIQNRDENMKKIAELIKGIGTAMLTSVDPDGSLHSRPMGTLKGDFDGVVWFFTKEHSPKVDEINRERQVNVAYVDTKGDRYVSLRGRAVVTNDKAKREELWNPIYKAWFPKGVDDPEIALLRIDVDRADYWDPPSSTMVQLFGFAKSVLTGQEYRPGPGEQGRVDLKH